MTVKGPLDKNKLRPATGAEIRNAFLQFYSERSHKIIPSASLIPEDPTVLLTIAGMLPFKPVFLGKEKPPAPRATSSQKCIRTNDIENVGRTARHHTFFEMLGNFSFGDYFKTEAIQWAWELITEIYHLDPENLIISVFREDDEAEAIWRNVVGVAPEKIIRMDEDDNFWSSGSTGPCGPCSEIYYDFKPELGLVDIDLEDDTRFIEFYNLVFMQYNRNSTGVLIPLENCNIDTGMGLERMAQILQGVPNNYETDLIFPLIKKVALLVDLDYKKISNKKKISFKIIADHSRAVTHLISDGVTASNLGKGYVLRRLLRRMIRHGRLIGIDQPFLTEICNAAIDLMSNAYPELLKKRDLILAELRTEEFRFLETLERGESMLAQIIEEGTKQISGFQAFELYDTFGFPLELTQEIAEEKGLLVDIKGFEREMEKQRQRAKAASVNIDMTLQTSIEKVTSNLLDTIFKGYEYLEFSGKIIAILHDGESVKQASEDDEIKIILDQTPFFAESGGQIGDKGVLYSDQFLVAIDGVMKENNVYIHSGIIKRGSLKLHDSVDAKVDYLSRRRAQSNHTATHLLQSALKLVIDSNVAQRGSLVAFDRLRFDFNTSSPMTPSQLEEVEILINKWISEAHPILIESMPIDQALAAGALAMFGEKYGEVVRVVDVPGVSMELCGGTHVANTSELALFKIVSETGIASGIRRIEAVAGPSVLDYMNERDIVVKQLSEYLKAQPSQILDRVLTLQNEIKNLNKELAVSRKAIALNKVLSLTDEAILIGDSQLIVKRLDGIDGSSMQEAAKHLMEQLGQESAIILGGLPDPNITNKIVFVAAFGSNLVKNGLNAGQFIGSIAKHCGGGGGGKPHIAQAGGRNANQLDYALDIAQETIAKSLS